MKIGIVAWKPTQTVRARRSGPQVVLSLAAPELFKAHAKVKATHAVETTKPIGFSVVFGET
jgi:hypothetical protein